MLKTHLDVDIVQPAGHFLRSKILLFVQNETVDSKFHFPNGKFIFPNSFSFSLKI